MPKECMVFVKRGGVFVGFQVREGEPDYRDLSSGKATREGDWEWNDLDGVYYVPLSWAGGTRSGYLTQAQAFAFGY